MPNEQPPVAPVPDPAEYLLNGKKSLIGSLVMAGIGGYLIYAGNPLVGAALVAKGLEGIGQADKGRRIEQRLKQLKVLVENAETAIAKGRADE